MVSHVSIDEKNNQFGAIVTAQFADFDEFIFSYEPDVAGGGVFIESDQLLPIGSRVRLSFTLASNGLPIIEGEGEVTEHRDPTDEASSGMVIRFENLQEKSKSLLSSLVQNYL